MVELSCSFSCLSACSSPFSFSVLLSAKQKDVDEQKSDEDEDEAPAARAADDLPIANYPPETDWKLAAWQPAPKEFDC